MATNDIILIQQVSSGSVERTFNPSLSANYVPRFITTGLGQGIIYDNGSKLGIGTNSPSATYDLSGNYAQNIVSVDALDINCSLGNFFTKTISADSTFTFSTVPSSRAFAFTLEVTHTSGAITWPPAVKWPNDTAPTLTTGKTHLFVFVTDDGGARWRGGSLINYVN